SGQGSAQTWRPGPRRSDQLLAAARARMQRSPGSWLANRAGSGRRANRLISPVRQCLCLGRAHLDVRPCPAPPIRWRAADERAGGAVELQIAHTRPAYGPAQTPFQRVLASAVLDAASE